MWKMSSNKLNSMSYWYEKLRPIKHIRTPRSIAIPIKGKHIYNGLMRGDEDIPETTSYLKKLKEILSKTAKDNFGFPTFMRTSEMSVKHSWHDTCFVDGEDKIWNNFWRLIEENYLATDQIPDSIYLRKYIPMESYFVGWSQGFPINKEVRTFFRTGKVMCIHPYWPREAMLQARIDDPDWEVKYKENCNITPGDYRTISRQLNLVMPKFTEEYGWSCDFSKGEDGLWYLIDMAMYPVSFHFPNCKNVPLVRNRKGEIRKDND